MPLFGVHYGSTFKHLRDVIIVVFYNIVIRRYTNPSVYISQPFLTYFMYHYAQCALNLIHCLEGS